MGNKPNDLVNTKRTKKPKVRKPKPKRNKKINNKVSFTGLSTEEEFKNTIMTHFSEIGGVNKLVKAASSYSNQKQMP